MSQQWSISLCSSCLALTTDVRCVKVPDDFYKCLMKHLSSAYFFLHFLMERRLRPWLIFSKLHCEMNRNAPHPLDHSWIISGRGRPSTCCQILKELGTNLCVCVHAQTCVCPSVSAINMHEATWVNWDRKKSVLQAICQLLSSCDIWIFSNSSVTICLYFQLMFCECIGFFSLKTVWGWGWWTSSWCSDQLRMTASVNKSNILFSPNSPTSLSPAPHSVSLAITSLSLVILELRAAVSVRSHDLGQLWGILFF